MQRNGKNQRVSNGEPLEEPEELEESTFQKQARRTPETDSFFWPGSSASASVSVFYFPSFVRERGPIPRDGGKTLKKSPSPGGRRGGKCVQVRRTENGKQKQKQEGKKNMHR